MHASWALGPSFLGLPVVVAGAGVLVAVGARRHAQALGAALVAEEEARLPVVRLGAPPLALPAALCNDNRNANALFALHSPALVLIAQTRRSSKLTKTTARNARTTEQKHLSI